MSRITRVGFCAHCFKERNPRTGQAFFAQGATETFHIYYAERNGEIGYTPHIYELIKVIGGNVVYRKMCTIENCGLYLDHKTGEFWLYESQWQRGIMTLNQWNSLVVFKDTGYKI